VNTNRKNGFKLFNAKCIFSGVSVYVQTKDPEDFNDLPHITYLDHTFKINEKEFSEFPRDSLIILDDFYFSTVKNKQEKLDFLGVVNYTLRHHGITLLLIIHNIYHTNLSSDIMLAPHLFMAYSNLGYSLLRYFFTYIRFKKTYFYTISFFRKLAARLGGQSVLEFYQEPSKLDYHFCYINSHRNYIINKVEQLFNGGQHSTMFVNNERFAIHLLDQPCSSVGAKHSASVEESAECSNSINDQVHNFVVSTYPKNKFLPLVFKNLVKHNLIDDDLFFIDFPSIHVADFCAFINNSFGKSSNSSSSSSSNSKNKTNGTLLKLCKFIRTKQIKFPAICIKNPVARQVLV